MFYDNFIRLCEQKGVSPTAVIRCAGASTGNLDRWRNGVTPKVPMLRRLSEALGVSVSELTGEEIPERDAAKHTGNSELVEYLDQLRERPEMRMLFSVAKNAKKSEIEAIVRFIESLRKS